MVHFVSAGPGSPDLITVRGRKLLEEADVVIYAGSLVNPALLDLTKEGCRIFNSAYLSLDQVLEIIREAEANNETTVRLHTGDTTLYSTIREQIEALDKETVNYDVTPGVSAFQAAAAALHAELTLPGITQSVILTRAGGRTKVPDRESIRAFASHRATMALYLSSSLADQVRQELLAGGYPEDTPVAVVYKASWPEEQILRATVQTFPELMKREEISRTAVILIGETLRGLGQWGGVELLPDMEHSRLYAPEFTTGYRKARKRTIWMCACTGQGTEQMERLRLLWEKQEAELCFELHVKCRRHPKNEAASLSELVRAAFDRVDAMVFFSSTGIAVRSIAPYLKSKVTDPAVIVIDEAGRYCIPVLSGHLGGANEYTETVCSLLKSQPVITTATDLEQRFSVDLFAKKNGLVISDMKLALEIAARVVAGEEVSLYSVDSIAGTPPEGVRVSRVRESADIIVETLSEALNGSERGFCEKMELQERKQQTLFLKEQGIILGIGCRRGTSKEQLLTAIDRFLSELGRSREDISGIASIDLKQNETGLLEVLRLFHVKHEFFTAEELMEQTGEFSSSEFVQRVTGTDCVCERAAVALSKGRLLVKKHSYEGVTLAAAGGKLCLRF